MNTIQRGVFSNKNKPFNVVFGGAANYKTDFNWYKSRFNMKNIFIDGDDVYGTSSGFTMANRVFDGSSSGANVPQVLTYIIDVDGNMRVGGDANNFWAGRQTNLTFIHSNSMNTTGRQGTQDTSLKEAYFPNLTGISSRCMSLRSSNVLGYFPKVTYVSSGLVQYNPRASSYHFFFNKDLKTNNNGNINSGVQSFINAGGTVTWIENEIKPDKVNNLTYEDLGGGNIKIDFTEPINHNQTRRYLVYIDDGTVLSKYDYYQSIQNSGDIVNGLNSGNYKIWIRVEDEYLNRSEMNSKKDIGLMSGDVIEITI